MRVLFVVWPVQAHFYPQIPLAWALQGAGHEVCVASHPDLADTITAAGLSAVPLGKDTGIPALATIGEYVTGEEQRAALADRLSIAPAERAYPWDMYSSYYVPEIRIFHPEGATPQDVNPGADDLVRFAQGWQPDLVLWEGVWLAAAVAARSCGAAHARSLWAPDYLGWGRARHLAAGLADPLAELVGPVAERYGVPVDAELLLGQWSIDPTPAEVPRLTDVRTVPVRRVPSTGATALPGWLHPKPERPRVALTLGASMRNYMINKPLISAMLDMMDGLDIEVVATFNEAQLEDQRVPDNVRTIDYIPLTQLLPTCSAIVHHGAGGTMSAATAHRVPQLIEMDGLEAHLYAPYVTGRGAGLTIDHQKDSTSEMRKQLLRLVEEPSFQAGADALHADWLALPAPADIVPTLERLTAQFRDRS